MAGALCIIVLSMLLSSQVDTARILLVPVPYGSHFMNFHQMGEALLEAGHDVHILTDLRCKTTSKLTKSGMTLHTYDTPGGCIMEDPVAEKDRAKVMLGEASGSKMLHMIMEVRTIAAKFAETIFRNETLFTELKSEKFDLCIVDGLIFFRFMYLVPYKLDIPIVSFLAVFNPVDASIPALPSFSPTIESGQYTDEMTFPQRLINTFQMFVKDNLIIAMIPSLWNSMVSEYASERPYMTLTELVSSSQLWLVQNDLAIDYPQVRLPHVVDIGGTNARPAKALSEQFLNIMEGATGDVVIVSFGSMLSSFPPNLSAKILDDLRQLKQTVIWRHDGQNIENVPPHVYLVEWLPQNDLLAHPKTKVFVTHCGANGQFEALFHAVPMVGLPLVADQVYNSKRMAKKGLGIHMDLFTFQQGELRASIEEVIHNEAYQIAMSRHSNISKDRPMSPKETLVYWVGHVIKYGADHLRSAGITMPWYKYWCVDIVCTYILLLLLTAFIMYKITRCVITLCLRLVRGLWKKDSAVKGKRKQKKK